MEIQLKTNKIYILKKRKYTKHKNDANVENNNTISENNNKE